MDNTSNDSDPGFAPFDLYPYDPAQPPAYAFMALFGIAAILHLAAMIPYRSWFPLQMIIGCVMETAAYYFRTRSHGDVRRILPFVVQNVLLLGAPPFLAASIYMSPRRIGRVLESEHMVLSPRMLTKMFVVVDVACLITQVAGAIMSGSDDPNEASQGNTLITVGLVLQIIAFVFFVTWAAIFHKRLKSASFDAKLPTILRWQKYLYGLYVISLLFIVRNITRLLEYNGRSGEEMLSNEAYLTSRTTAHESETEL
ncbi:hypothetical protein S40293_08352 [Stachybotrys chartarum IBT 40293]|nr:hypothetical protein S40293_08352 [Stachybotrys chartarum IBT 40293]